MKIMRGKIQFHQIQYKSSMMLVVQTEIEKCQLP